MREGKWSLELEILDQLEGGELPVSALRAVSGTDALLAKALLAMVRDGQIRVRAGGGTELPVWALREALAGGLVPDAALNWRVSLIERGGKLLAGGG